MGENALFPVTVTFFLVHEEWRAIIIDDNV